MKIKYLIWTLFLSILLTINVKAATLTLEGDKTINYQNTGYIDLKLKSGVDTVNKVECTLDYNTTQLDITQSSKYLSSFVSNVSILSAATGSLSDGVIASFKVSSLFNGNGTSTIKVNNIKINDVLVSDTLSYDLTLTAPKPHSSALLSSLTGNVGTMSPSFSQATYAYKVNIPKDTIPSITLYGKCLESGCQSTVTCETEGCTVNGTKVSLIIGKNIVHYKVTSEDNSDTKDYVLTVYRGPSTDNSSYLKSLSLKGFDLKEKFDKDTLDYTTTVSYDYENVTVNYESEDPTASVEVKGDKNLKVGDNVVTVTVTSSETKDKRIYNITVTREDFKAHSSTTTAAILTNDTSKKSTKVWLIIIISLIGAGIIGAAGYFIFRKKKPNDKNKKDIISDEGQIKNKNEKLEDVEVKDNSLEDDLNITESPQKPSVDAALADLMETKDLELTKEYNLKDNHLS